MKTERLKTSSLSSIRNVYKKLERVDSNALDGFYRANFIGPWWLRATAPPSLKFSGLSGWQGKKFLSKDSATNILKTQKGFKEKLEMSCRQVHSAVDGRLVIALTYPANAPLPWRWVVDEMRQLDDSTLLCMTVFNLPILKHFPLPFILTKEGDK